MGRKAIKVYVKTNDYLFVWLGMFEPVAGNPARWTSGERRRVEEKVETSISQTLVI
jgi:hypothetical protein